MPILIKPIRGRGIPVNTTTTLTERLSSDSDLTFELLEDEHNHDVVRAISRKWKVSRVEGPKDHRDFIVTRVDRESRGKKQKVTIKCRIKAIDIIKGKRKYSNISGSFTAENYFSLIFKNTGVDYELTHKVSSSKFENAGEGESVHELLKKGMDHYGLEYDIKYDSKKRRYKFVLTPFLEKKAAYYISDEINANNVKLEEDSEEYATYVVGYGDFTDEQGMQQAGLIMKYEHPDMEDIGKIEAEPIVDGRIKSEDLMKRMLENKINSTLKQSLTLDFIALKKHFPNAVAKVADIVPVKHTIIGINGEQRIVEVVTKRDENNRIYKQDVVLGEMNRRQRYMKRVNEAASVVSGLGGGSFASSYKSTRSKASAVTESTKNALDLSKALNASANGLKAVNGDKILTFDKYGRIRVSKDGGKTYTNIITTSGFNKYVIPYASSKVTGLMSAKDKKKLDSIDTSDLTPDTPATKPITQSERTKLSNLEVNSNGLVITGDDKKKYNLTVQSGKLIIKEAN